MKKICILLILFCCMSACDKNEEEVDTLKYAKISIRNLTSSDIKITSYDWQGDVSFEIPKGEYGAEQICDYSTGSYGNYDITDDKVILMYSFSKITIEIGDSTLNIPSVVEANVGERFVQVLRSIDSSCYSKIFIKDTVKEVYTFTDETIKKLIYFYQEKYDVDIVKHE